MRVLSKLSRKTWMFSSLAVLGLNVALESLAMAQEPETRSAAAAVSFDFFTVWILGGGGIGFLFVLPIEVASIATVAFVIEHFVSILRDKLVPPEIVVELET